MGILNGLGSGVRGLYDDLVPSTAPKDARDTAAAKALQDYQNGLNGTDPNAPPPADDSRSKYNLGGGGTTTTPTNTGGGANYNIGADAKAAGAPTAAPVIGANGLMPTAVSPDDPTVAQDPAVIAAQAAYDAAYAAANKSTVVNKMTHGTANPDGVAVDPALLVARTDAEKALADAKALAAQRLTAQQTTSGPSIYATPPPAYTATTYTVPTSNVAATPTFGNITPGTLDTHQFSAPTLAGTPVIADPRAISAGTVTAERIGNVGSASAPTIAATTIDRILMDRTNSDASRQEFLNAIAMTRDAAEGKAPSAAEALLRKGIDENIGTAYGMAASLQGRNPGLALRTGAITAKDAIAKSAADMAALRADEIAKARGQYGTLSQGMNANDIQQSGLQLGADVDIAKTNANSLLEAAKSNQASAVQTSIANLNAAVNVAIANQSAALKAGEINVANDLQAKIETLRAQTTVAVSNARNAVDSNIAQLNANLETLKANQLDARATGQFNVANDLEAQITKFQAEKDAALQTQRLLTENDQANADRTARANADNAAATNDAGKFNVTNTINNTNYNADRAFDLSTTNADLNLRQQIINDARANGLRDDQIELLLAQMGLTQSAINAENQYNAARDAGYANLLTSAATMGIGGVKQPTAPGATPTSPTYTLRDRDDIYRPA